jgi:hypothetical protein
MRKFKKAIIFYTSAYLLLFQKHFSVSKFHKISFGGIENATHNTFPKKLLLEMYCELHFQFRRAHYQW